MLAQLLARVLWLGYASEVIRKLFICAVLAATSACTLTNQNVGSVLTYAKTTTPGVLEIERCDLHLRWKFYILVLPYEASKEDCVRDKFTLAQPTPPP